MFSKLRASEILSMCNPRNGVYLKISASEICTSETRAIQGPPVPQISCDNISFPKGLQTQNFKIN